MPELSVIVCTYNRSEYLPDLLESIKKQDFNRDRFELIIIDNNSTDPTSTISKDFINRSPDLNARYYLETNSGLSFARNRGIKESKGEVLVFVDDDAVAVPDYLLSIAEYFKSHSNIAAGGGKILPRYENEPPDWMTPFLLPVVSALDMGDKIRYFPAKKYPIGANMFFRREVFDKVGMFNPNLGRKGKKLLGGEEKDMFLRMGSSQKIVYLPEACIFHIVPKKRLEQSYITEMAYGVGYSEKIRNRAGGKKLFRMYLTELFKWMATILLFFIYLVKLEYPKSRMLLIFRYYVSKGMLTENKNDH
jgi:glycosyltransferase involved in cell wall biosynthesis